MEEQEKIEPVPDGTAPEDKSVFISSPEAQAVADAALKDLRDRSFSERHPELGKMVKCAVCGLRHRKEERKCVQKFKALWIDEDPETLERSVVYATVPLHGQRPRNPVKLIFGAAQFKGKRKIKRPNIKERRLVEMTRVLFPAFDGVTPDAEKQMHMARKLAKFVLKRLYRIKADCRSRQQEVSRRINRGTLRPGTRV
jgi:hypothetical protein